MHDDAKTRGRDFPAYAADPLAETLKAIDGIAAGAEFAKNYATFQRDMVYGDGPDFATATLLHHRRQTIAAVPDRRPRHHKSLTVLHTTNQANKCPLLAEDSVLLSRPCARLLPKPQHEAEGNGQPMLKALWQFFQDSMDALRDDDRRVRREQKEAEATRRRYQDWLQSRQL
jgi:hypothetical protein